MFNVFRRSIINQKNKFKKGFQDIIRPVIDDAVKSAYQQRGAVRNNFPNSSNQNTLQSLNNLLGRNQYVVNAAFSTFTLLISFAGLHIALKAFQAQLDANMLTKELIESNKKLVESNKKMAEAIEQYNKERSISRYFDMFRGLQGLVELARIGFARFGNINSGGRPSGTRNPEESDYDTPPSGRAFRDNQSRRGGRSGGSF